MTDRSKKKDKNKGKDKDKDKINIPHDAFFKRIMENQIAAKEFLEEYIPANIKNMIDLDAIKVQKETYIEPNLTKRMSDIVYRVNTVENDEAFIYVLCEHQSSVDQFMAFRLWRYILLLAEHHTKDKDKIPLIVPIVIYNGKAKYTAPRNLWALFEHPEIAKNTLTEDHILVNLQAMSDDDIIKKKHLALFEYVFKHIHMRDMLKLWKNLLERLPEAVIIDQKYGYFYIINLLWYTDSKIPVDKQDELNSLISEHLPKEEGGDIMQTIAESYVEQGVLKGIEKGREEGIEKGIEKGVLKGIEKTATNMLREGADIEFVTRVTGLSLDCLLKLKTKL